MSKNNWKYLLLLFLFVSIKLFASNDSVQFYLDRADTCSSFKDKLLNYNKALHLSKAQSDTVSIASAYNYLGHIYLEMGNSNDIAISHFLKAQHFYELKNDMEGLASVNNNMAILYSQMGRTQESIKLFKYSLELEKKNSLQTGDSAEYIDFLYDTYYLNLGSNYYIASNYDSALHYFNLNVNFHKKNKLQISPGIMSNIGVIYYTLDQIDSALFYFHEDYKIGLELKNDFLVFQVINNIGEIYLQSQQIDSAEKYIRLSDRYVQKVNAVNIDLKHLDSEYRLDKLKGNYKEAVFKLEEINNLKDSLNVIELDSRISNLKTISEIELKDERIKYLLKEKEIEKKNQRYKNIILSVLLILLVLSILSAIVFFLQKRRITEANRIIVKKNMELVDQNALINTGSKAPKYQTSTLSEEKKEEVLKKLNRLLKEDKIFLQKDLSLDKTAEKLAISRTYLSQIINEEYQTNFRNIINKERVNHAIDLFSKNSSNRYSIAGIADISGFNSISSFNQIFKSHTGMTPSLFRKIASESSK